MSSAKGGTGSEYRTHDQHADHTLQMIGANQVFRPRSKSSLQGVGGAPMVGVGPHGGGGSSGGRFVRIRDNMDDILEARRLFRKHVAEDNNSIYRAVSDALWGTQVHFELLKKSVSLMTSYEKECASGSSQHSKARSLAYVLDIRIDIVQYEASSLKQTQINKRQTDGPDAKAQRRVDLCFTPPHQYDPIYTMEHVENCGFVQSLIYNLLYVELFNLHDASDAAKIMLSDLTNKPEIYDREFQGTATQALLNNLIPFPYKVAKTLCPDSYRNIEYDVWSRENRASKKSPTTKENRSFGLNDTRKSGRDVTGRRRDGRRGGNRGQQQQHRVSAGSGKDFSSTIGSLPEGSPVFVRAEGYEDVFGYFVRITEDRRKAEVYVPTLDDVIFPPRKAVLPLKDDVPCRALEASFNRKEANQAQNGSICDGYDGMDNFCGLTLIEEEPTHELGCCEATCQDHQTRVNGRTTNEPSPASEASVQAKNMVLMACGDPDWEAKVDFSVPPPALVTTADPQLPLQSAAAAAATGGFPIMPSSPPTSAGPILVLPVPCNMLTSPLPPLTPGGHPVTTPHDGMHIPPGLESFFPPATPTLGVTPSMGSIVRMPNSPFVFQFPTPHASPAMALPPQQVFTFPDVQLPPQQPDE